MIVSSLEIVRGVAAKLRGYPFLIVDLETTGTNPRSHKLISIAILVPDFEPLIIDCRQIDMKELGRVLRDAFEDTLIIGQNLKFDYQFLSWWLGIQAKNTWDTMIAEQIIQGRGFGDAIGFSLKDIALRRGLKANKEERNWFIDLDQREEWNEPFPEKQLRYICQDVMLLEPIYYQQEAEIIEKKLTAIAQLEMSVVPCLAQLELNGVRIDQDKWREVIREEQMKAEQHESEAITLFGPLILAAREPVIQTHRQKKDTWIASRDQYIETLKYTWEQCGEQLMEDYGQGTEQYKGWGDFKMQRMKVWREQNPNPGPLHLPVLKITSHDQLKIALKQMGHEVESVDDDHLEALVEKVPEVKIIQSLRKSKKIVESYGESLLNEVDPVTSKHHFPYTQLVNTSRMAASRIQQIPRRGIGERLRACIIPDPGCDFCIGDFSNQELRILADLTRAEQLLDFFAQGVDVHGETARRMLNLDESINVKKDLFAEGVTYRDVAKVINFGLIYGMSAAGLARTIGVSKDQAETLMRSYFDLYPEVEKWIAKQGNQAVEKLSVRTKAGWCRTFDALPPHPVFTGDRELYREAKQKRNMALNRIRRQGPNTQIQGLAASITKKALCLFSEMAEPEEKMIAVVHDEFVVQTLKEKSKQMAKKLADAMDKACQYYLKSVHIPRNEVVIREYWSKE